MLSSLSPYEPRLRYRIQPCDQEILALARKAGHRVGPGATWPPREEEAYREMPKPARQRGAKATLS
jgi:hypothetical protein